MTGAMVFVRAVAEIKAEYVHSGLKQRQDCFPIRGGRA
jgi:hypothetical protein